MENPKYWRYRAIDREAQIIEGIAKAPSFMNLCLIKRQQQLQIIEATELQPDQLRAERHLSSMQQMLNKHWSTDEDDQSNTSKSVVVIFWRYLIKKLYH